MAGTHVEPQTIGEAVLLVRKFRGLSQQKLADLAGLTQGTICHIELCRTSSLETLGKISKAMDIPLAFLFVLCDHQPSEVQAMNEFKIRVREYFNDTR